MKIISIKILIIIQNLSYLSFLTSLIFLMVSKNLYTYPKYSSGPKDSKNVSYVEVHFKKNYLLTPNSKLQRGLNMTFLYDKTILKINREITKN